MCSDGLVTSSFTLQSASRCRLRGSIFCFWWGNSIASDQDLGALSMTSLRHSIPFQSLEKACYSCDDPPPNRMATGERATFAGDHSLPFVRLIPPSFNQLSSNNLLVTPHSYPSITSNLRLDTIPPSLSLHHHFRASISFLPSQIHKATNHVFRRQPRDD